MYKNKLVQIFMILIIVFSVFKMFYLFVYTPITYATPDFYCYYWSARNTLENKGLYDYQKKIKDITDLTEIQKETRKLVKTERKNYYVQFPVTAIFWCYLGLFDLDNAHTIWLLILLAGFIIGLYYLYKDYLNTFNNQPEQSDKLLAIAIITFLPAMLGPVFVTFWLTNVNAIVFLMLVLFLKFFKEDRVYLSSLFLTLAIILKISPIVIMFYLILKGKWKYFLYTSIFGIVIVLLTLPITGIDAYYDWYDYAYLGYISKFNVNWNNFSIKGVLSKLFLPIPPYNYVLFNYPNLFKYLYYFITLLFSVMISYVIIKNRKRKEKIIISLEVGFFISSFLLLFPHSETFHFMFLLIPWIVLIHYFSHYYYNKYLVIITAFSYVPFTILYRNINMTYLLQGPGIIFLLFYFYGNILLWLVLFVILLKFIPPKLSATNNCNSKNII